MARSPLAALALAIGLAATCSACGISTKTSHATGATSTTPTPSTGDTGGTTVTTEASSSSTDTGSISTSGVCATVPAKALAPAVGRVTSAEDRQGALGSSDISYQYETCRYDLARRKETVSIKVLTSEGAADGSLLARLQAQAEKDGAANREEHLTALDVPAMAFGGDLVVVRDPSATLFVEYNNYGSSDHQPSRTAALTTVARAVRATTRAHPVDQAGDPAGQLCTAAVAQAVQKAFGPGATPTGSAGAGKSINSASFTVKVCGYQLPGAGDASVSIGFSPARDYTRYLNAKQAFDRGFGRYQEATVVAGHPAWFTEDGLTFGTRKHTLIVSYDLGTISPSDLSASFADQLDQELLAVARIAAQRVG